MATVAPKIHPSASDPLDFFRGLAVAMPLSLMLWIALFRVTWWLWRG